MPQAFDINSREATSSVPVDKSNSAEDSVGGWVRGGFFEEDSAVAEIDPHLSVRLKAGVRRSVHSLLGI
jgi:hypothetical protein